jgi:hypothetical protein
LRFLLKLLREFDHYIWFLRKTPIACDHDDQIGRIFVYWAVVYFGLLFENDKSSKNKWAHFFHGSSYVCIHFDKNGLGNSLGDSFSNSSGHRACDPNWQQENTHLCFQSVEFCDQTLV